MTAAITVTDLGKTYVVPEREGGVRAALGRAGPAADP